MAFSLEDLWSKLIDAPDTRATDSRSWLEALDLVFELRPTLRRLSDQHHRYSTPQEPATVSHPSRLTDAKTSKLIETFTPTRRPLRGSPLWWPRDISRRLGENGRASSMRSDPIIPSESPSMRVETDRVRGRWRGWRGPYKTNYTERVRRTTHKSVVAAVASPNRG